MSCLFPAGFGCVMAVHPRAVISAHASSQARRHKGPYRQIHHMVCCSLSSEFSVLQTIRTLKHRGRGPTSVEHPSPSLHRLSFRGTDQAQQAPCPCARLVSQCLDQQSCSLSVGPSIVARGIPEVVPLVHLEGQQLQCWLTNARSLWSVH